jgi:hypothetical protein
VSGENLLGRAQSLLDSLREKGLHLPNPTRVDGDTDAVAALADEVRTIAREEEVSVIATFETDGRLAVRARGAERARVAFVEVRAFAPWREGPRVVRVPAAGDRVFVEGVDRDGPINVAVLDIAGAPLGWCTVELG